MGDYALIWDTATGTADIELDAVADDVTSDNGLRTAVLLSLCVDARAEPEDALPGNDGDRRGWLFDELAEAEGDRIGSRRWLVTERGKLTPDLVPQIQRMDREALQWLIDDGVAASVEVTAEIVDGALVEQIDIERPARGTISFRFDFAWNSEAARAL